MEYRLVIVAGDAKRKVLKIKPPVIIGRSRDADVPVGHPLVSRRHCEITVSEEGTLIVEDLGSLNGTYHGDQRITEPVYLEPGDMLTVGSITFQAQYGDFQPDDEPPVLPAVAKAPAAKAPAKTPSKPQDDDELPDFMTAGPGDDEEDEDEDMFDPLAAAAAEAAAEIEEEEPAEEEAEEEEEEFKFPEIGKARPKPTEPEAKKRRPPPSLAPEPTDEEALLEESEDEEAAAEDDELGESHIAIGDEDRAEIEEEEEVEVGAGDSRTGDSGSGMSWLTGNDDDDEKTGDSGLDDFFKSL